MATLAVWRFGYSARLPAKNYWTRSGSALVCPRATVDSAHYSVVVAGRLRGALISLQDKETA